jgi:hypothetical protein
MSLIGFLSYASDAWIAIRVASTAASGERGVRWRWWGWSMVQEETAAGMIRD